MANIMAKIEIDKNVAAMADAFAEREYETDGYERQWLSKGYYHGYMDAMKEAKMSPEDKMMKAIFGKEESGGDLPPVPGEDAMVERMSKKWDELLAKNKPSEE